MRSVSASLLSSQASRRQPARHRHFPVARSQSPWFEHGACSRTLDATASFKVHCGTSQASPGSVDSHSNVPRAGLPPCGACASTGAGAHSSKVTSHPSVVWEQDAFWTVGSELIARPHVRRRAPPAAARSRRGTEAQPAVDLAARRRRDGQRDRTRDLVLRQRVVAARAVDLLAGGARHARLADAERGGEGGVGRRAVAPEVAVGRAGRAHGRAEADGDEGEGAAPPHPPPSWPQWRGWAWQPPFLTIWELVSRSHQGETLLFWSSSSGWLLVRQPNLYGTCTPML